jgi:large subunit ribosomal protein L23
MDKTLILTPRLSEKVYGASQKQNTYVFDVPKSANKHSVARAVVAQYEVTVEDVNVVVVKGKTKRTVRKRGRVAKGKQNDVKKAYVRLKEGDSLPIFAGVEEAAEKQERVQELAEKATEKRAKDAEKEKK